MTFIDSSVIDLIAKPQLRAINSGGTHRLVLVVEPHSRTERVLRIGESLPRPVRRPGRHAHSHKRALTCRPSTALVAAALP